MFEAKCTCGAEECTDHTSAETPMNALALLGASEGGFSAAFSRLDTLLLMVTLRWKPAHRIFCQSVGSPLLPWTEDLSCKKWRLSRYPQLSSLLANNGRVERHKFNSWPTSSVLVVPPKIFYLRSKTVPLFLGINNSLT